MRNVLASQFMNPTDTNLLALSSNTGSGFLWSCSLDLVTALLGFEGAAAAFFWALAAFVFSLAALMARSRCALRTSGFWFLLAKISVREAPTMARWNFWVLRVFLGLFLFLSLLVLTSVKDGPGGVTRIPLHQMGTFTFRIEEMVNFSVNTDHGLAM